MRLYKNLTTVEPRATQIPRSVPGLNRRTFGAIRDSQGPKQLMILVRCNVTLTLAASDERDLQTASAAEISGTAPHSPGSFQGSSPRDPAPACVIEQSEMTTEEACGSIRMAGPSAPSYTHRVITAEDACSTSTPRASTILSRAFWAGN